MPIPALLAAAPGLIQAGASLFGGKKRREAERNAQARFDQTKAQLENFQFENPYANQENVFEDATINLDASNFQAQQEDNTLAAGLDSFVASGGGGGGAQAFAQAALQSAGGRSADIARQEQQNQARALGHQATLNQQEAQGAETLQSNLHGQVQQNYNLHQQDLQQAQAARKEATNNLIGGVTSALGGAIGAGAFSGKGGGASGEGGGGGFLGKLKGLFGGGGGGDATPHIQTTAGQSQLGQLAALSGSGLQGPSATALQGGGGILAQNAGRTGTVDVGIGSFGGNFGFSGPLRRLKDLYK